MILYEKLRLIQSSVKLLVVVIILIMCFLFVLFAS